MRLPFRSDRLLGGSWIGIEQQSRRPAREPRELPRRRVSRIVVVAATVAMAVGLTGVAFAVAQHSPKVLANGLRDLATITPVLACSELVGVDLTGVTDAPVTITSATVSTVGAPAPYCAVRGTIGPADTTVMRLPVNGWTQRYLQTGCGGLCGSSNINYAQAATCQPIADGTIASATTDMGHQGLNDGSWAASNPQAQIDFAYRGVHVTAQVAKAIIARFYGKAPVYSYFDGCSDGGREGLMEAQRYPDDFDAIVAGAPANNMVVQNTYHHAWNVLTNLDQDGKYILLANRLPLVHAAVLAACDGRDGTTDGVLDDPRRCDFNPASLICQTGQDTSTCLSEAEAGVVQRLHDGATDEHGMPLEVPVAHEWGSELEWTLFVPAAQGQHVGSEMFVLGFARYLGFQNVVQPGWQLSDLDFSRDGFWRTVQSSSYLSALDPDLSGFEKSGGKLILWHGWNDQHIAPRSTIAYYDALREAMSPKVAEGFARLYLFPGVAHCGGGAGANTFDILTPAMAWTESGARPGGIVATNPTTGLIRTVAPVDSKGAPDAEYNWLGKRLYSSDYQVWCRAQGTSLVCEPATTWLTKRTRAK